MNILFLFTHSFLRRFTHTAILHSLIIHSHNDQSFPFCILLIHSLFQCFLHSFSKIIHSLVQHPSILYFMSSLNAFISSFNNSFTTELPSGAWSRANIPQVFQFISCFRVGCSWKISGFISSTAFWRFSSVRSSRRLIQFRSEFHEGFLV